MAIRVKVKYPNELSVQPYSVWDAATFNSVADLTPVTTWADSYGTGRNLTYIGTVKAPFVSTERLNDNKVLECDAVDSRLRLLSPSYASDFSFSLVSKLAGTAQAGFRLMDFGISLRFNTTNYNISTTASATIPSVSFGDPYSWSIITVTRSGSTLNVYNNLVLVATVSNSDSLFTALSAFGNPNSYSVGRFMKTYIAEINTFNYGLSKEEVIMNQRYLKFKWKL